uniref:Uncharacterized protein n=1 Tax=Craspedostauros australis TaxID=1486917 RepID=A0A7R9WNB1_9STRA
MQPVASLQQRLQHGHSTSAGELASNGRQSAEISNCKAFCESQASTGPEKELLCQYAYSNGLPAATEMDNSPVNWLWDRSMPPASTCVRACVCVPFRQVHW